MSEIPSHINHILRGHSGDGNLKDLFPWFLSRNQALNRFLLLKKEESSLTTFITWIFHYFPVYTVFHGAGVSPSGCVGARAGTGAVSVAGVGAVVASGSMSGSMLDSVLDLLLGVVHSSPSSAVERLLFPS